MITLNLISPKKKQEFKIKQIYIMAKDLVILILLVTIVSSIILLLAKLIIQNNFNRVVEYSTLTTRYANIFNKDVKEFNLYINTLVKIQEKNIDWTKLIIQLSKLVPEGVNLDSINIQPEKMLITGFAFDRENLKKFQEDLEKNELFLNVEIPLNDLIKRNNINFNLKADINLDWLKKI